ncbi:hypothetical protein [Burkholderia ambifaria]|jgi:hypothetical protein|uniref:hypothetical protein n=1 Tax=Burkholderia ambifaria TaxID=152480 RepID=UPI001B92289D|nr:hypothetical protein [Burkholderia ambifaria]MBR8225112.1 hypothetical protein [Burkholderia ambifaria]
MTQQQFFKRLAEFGRKNPIVTLSWLVLSCGALPLLFYANGVEQLPDFTLSELTGTLIASFALELMLLPLIGWYCVLAGLAARAVLNRFYPDVPASTVPGTIVAACAATRQQLVQGKFIVLVSLLTGMIWLDVLSAAGGFSPFSRWQEPAMMVLVSTTYVAAYVAMFGLILFDWRVPGLRRHLVHRALWSLFLFSVLVNVATFLVHRRMHGTAAPAPSPDAHPIAYVADNIHDALPDIGHWFMAGVAWLNTWLTRIAGGEWIVAVFRLVGHGLAEYGAILVCVILSVVALWMSVRRLWYGLHGQQAMNWLCVAVMPWLIRATLLSLASPDASLAKRIMLGAASVVGVIWMGIWILGTGRQSWHGGGAAASTGWRLIGVKLLITGMFAGAASIVLVFVLLIVDQGRPDGETMALANAIAPLCLLNWWAFNLRRGWKPLGVVCGLSAFFMLVLVPQISGNPLFFPKLVVRGFGLGYLHADNLALSGQQCATLAPYGVRCNKGKDDAIALTHVNIVNRLGSSVQLELMLRATHGLAKGAGAQPSDGVVPFRIQTLTIGDDAMPFTDAPFPRKPMAGCDDLLVARLIDAIRSAKEHVTKDGPALPDEKAVESLACVRFVVPKDQLISYERSGARTYGKGYSGYIAVPDKPEAPKK